MGDVAGTYEDFLNNQALIARLTSTSGYAAQPVAASVGISSGGAMQADYFSGLDPNGLANQLQAGILGPIVEELPAIVGSIGAGMTLSKAACALFPSLCSSGIMSTQGTPNAGLLTGSCPPGRVLRRISMGRDKCIKKPRMNPLNPKALNRAVRRLSGFQNFATRTEKAIRHSFVKAGVRPVHRTRAGACGTCRKKTCGGC